MDTPRLELPLLAAAQAQKHVTVNESLMTLDALVQLAVERRDLAAPPASPAEGDRFIVAAGSGGDWAGRTGQVADRRDGAWVFLSPQPGWIAWVQAEASLLAYDGTSWVDVAGAGGAGEVAALGVGVAADPENPLTVAASQSLFSHAGTDHRLKVNKAAATNTASLLLQTGFGGRAEVGLCGDDRLHVKVSADGASWTEALVADAASGEVAVGHVGGAPALTAGPDAVKIGATLIQAGPYGGSIELMSETTGDRPAFIDFHSCDVWSDYSLRLIRYSGADGASALISNGAGGIVLAAVDAAPVSILTTGVERLTVTADGRIGIGVTTPNCALQVEGAVRPGRYAGAAAPSASAAGLGALVVITDDPTGPKLAFSDGARWVRLATS